MFYQRIQIKKKDKVQTIELKYVVYLTAYGVTKKNANLHLSREGTP